MKKLYTFLFLIIALCTNAQIVNIPDANFKTKLLQASSSNNIASNQVPTFYPNIAWANNSSDKIDTNDDGEIQVNEAQAIKWLDIRYANASNLTGIEAFSNLIYLDCSYNQLTSLNIANLVFLNNLNCRYNQLQNLFNITNCTNLKQLACDNNQLVNLNVSGLQYLINFFCWENQLTTLDVSSLPNLNNFSCSDNQLTTLNIKNNNINWYSLSFNYNSNLAYICADDEDISYVQNLINQYGYSSTCHVNSYCSFTPGGTFYTIQGNNHFDFNNNGCETNDSFYPNLKFNITNGATSGTLISNSSGSYSIPVSAGTHTFTPILENPSYFNISPTSTTVSFPATTSPFNQDFCVTANDVHHDLEVSIIPITAVRPGFNATYKIKFKNKGNQVENSTLNFNYDDNVSDLISTSVATSSQNSGVLTWSLGNIVPFQQGEITVVLNLNSPAETPALNSGDILNFTATISSVNTDETPIDNSFALNQTVVNSYDPNDKRCLEGEAINPSMIGQYVHYMIRFENTGTYPAENIVVKDMIDTSKFDISTLQMTDASHTCYTRINGNKVEFIFENINLPFDDATNDGYVVFKIKTLPTLTVGSTISNNANIYFDYNFPIVTNTATSTFTTLKNNDFDFANNFTLFPNPVENSLSITNRNNLEITSISIYNTLGQLILIETNPSNSIDTSSLKKGSYFIKIISDKGISSSKFIKE